LTMVAQNDDIVPLTNRQSRVTFNPSAGTTYKIAVDGWSNAVGAVVLRINAPPNDAFASCETISGLAGTVTAHTIGASKEEYEPAHAGNIGGHSVWYCWTAPTNIAMTFDTAGSAFDTLLAIYNGTNLNFLSLIASDNDSGENLSSRVAFNAEAGNAYCIAVDTFASAEPGNFTLHWSAMSRLEISRRTNGAIDLTLNALPGNYRILVSSNLAQWATLTSLTVTNAPRHYIDNNVSRPRRFYRAQTQP
jgi:hypothetical protein